MREPADVIACFDATGAAVFTTTCHLAAGDLRAAEALLTDTYREFAREPAVGTDIGAMRCLAHRVALQSATDRAPSTASNPLAKLPMRERVAISLSSIEGQPADVVATVLHLSEDDARVVTQRALLTLADLAPGEQVDVLVRATETWFDDSTRERVRESLAQPAPSAPPVPAAANATTSTSTSTNAQRRRTRSRSAIGRRVAIIGATAAVLAAGFAWVSPTKHRDRPSDIAAAIASLPPAVDGATNDQTVTARPDPSVGYVIGTPPTGFVAAGAYEQSHDDPTVGWFTLWASPDATRSTGRWFAVLTELTPLEFGLTPAANRTTINAHPALIRRTADSAMEITATAVDPPADLVTAASPSDTKRPFFGGDFTLTGGGYTGEELISLASSIYLQDGQPHLLDSARTLTTGTDVVVEQPSTSSDLDAQVYASGGPTSYYQRADGVGLLQLAVSPTTTNDLRAARLLLRPAPGSIDVAAPPLTTSQTDTTLNTEADSRRTTVSTDADGNTVLQWHDGTDTLTLSGTLDAIPMLSVALTVRQASASEWTTLLTTAQPMFDDGVETSSDAALTDLNAMTTASGDRWTFKVTNDLGALEVAHTSDAVGGNAWSSREPFRFDTLGALTTFGSGTATVVAFAIHDPKSAVALRVTVGAGQPIDAPLVAVTANDGTVNYAAAQAFSEIDKFSVALVDASGNVVRQLARQA